ncbi:MAG TPA: hypothetical protein VFR62_14820 [Gemmatimonadales bacterium]|nr:hypothetical protein [Gemmatimonadales bacterium]
MSVLSYVRLRCGLAEGLERYGQWVGMPEIGPRRLVPEREAIELAMDNDEWPGLAVFVYPSGPWTVIEELSGGLSERPVTDWLELARGGDLVYAGYNDAIPYAQLIVVEGGRRVREFLRDEQDPSQDVDAGQLPEEGRKRLKTWIDVTRWVEEDELKLTRPEHGWLWVHRAA